MPLPFVLAGAALVAGGFGVKKGIDAASDYSDAKDANRLAQNIYDEASRDLQEHREQARNSMESLGALKFKLYKESLIPFIETFSKIKEIDFDDKSLVNKELPQFSSETLKDMEEDAPKLRSLVEGGITALGSGALAGLAAYGGVGAMGAASTGTAIGALSGVAATNATLAWLGGGSLAAGGYGMAGGMAVLGGVVAGPVLAVGGMMLASKAAAAKEKARESVETARLARSEMAQASVATDGIRLRFEEIAVVLKHLDEHFQPLLNSLQELVNRDDNYQNYSMDERKFVFSSASMAKVLKNIMESQVINEEGTLTEESRSAVDEGQEALKKAI